MTLKKSRRVAIVGFIISIAVAFVVYFGEKAIYDFLLQTSKKVEFANFLRNFIQVEHALIYTKYMILIMAIVVLGLNITGLILTSRPFYRRVVVGGSFFFAAGVVEMLALGVSILGWTAGCLLLISGILCIKSAQEYL